LSFESITTTILYAPEVTITSLQNKVALDAWADASWRTLCGAGSECEECPDGQETLVGLRVEVRSMDGFKLSDLANMSGTQTSGLQLYRDNPNAGVQREFDTQDIFIPTQEAVAVLNYFADNPGVDGILGTYDDQVSWALMMTTLTKFFSTMVSSRASWIRRHGGG